MADPAQRRRLTVLALLVILGAAAAVAAAGMTWWTQSFVDALSGVVTTRATGSQADPLLVPVALLGLAGFGAALATTGGVRRAVGGLLTLGGGSAAALALIRLASAPATLHTDLIRPAQSPEPARLHLVGPLLGAVGGLSVAVAGVLLLAGSGAAAHGRRPALDARYDAPTTRRRAAEADPTGLDPAVDPEAAAGWWKALDAGRDPTRPAMSTADEAVGSADETPADPAAADRTPSADRTTRPPGTEGAGVCDEVTRGG